MRKKSRLVGGKIKKRSIFKKYNPFPSLKKFFGLTKKETWNEKQKRHKQEFKAFVETRKKEKNNKKRSKKKK
jgi:hypothetical protein